MPLIDGLIALSVRCMQPAQQQGRRSPRRNLSFATIIRLVRVSGFTALVIQHINSLRAKGVMSFHACRAAASPFNIAVISLVVLCTVPFAICCIPYSIIYQLRALLNFAYACDYAPCNSKACLRVD